MTGIEWTALLAVVAALEVTVLVPLVVILHSRLSAELKALHREQQEERREHRNLLHQIRDDTRVTERLALEQSGRLTRIESATVPPEDEDAPDDRGDDG